MQLNQYDLNIEKGKKYMVAFDAHASGERTIFSTVGKNGDPWTNYSAYEQISISTTKQTYTYSFEMGEPTGPAARLVFDMGLSTANIFLDNIILMQVGYTSFWADVDNDGDVDNEGQGDGDIDIVDIQLVAAWWNKKLP